jgi:hypothetical protein
MAAPMPLPPPVTNTERCFRLGKMDKVSLAGAVRMEMGLGLELAIELETGLEVFDIAIYVSMNL